MNVYKPPPNKLQTGSLLDAPAPAVYAGNFNCWNTDWSYITTNPDGAYLAASTADAVLLFNLKEPHSFISRCWNTETNPDLAFAKVIGQEPLQVRRILDRFPYSKHRPSLITTPLLVHSMEGKPVWRWNFRKANWSEFTNSTNTAAQALPVPYASNINDSYLAYCTMLTNTAKKHVQGSPKELRPCWTKECEEPLDAHNEAKTNTERARAATELMTWLNTKGRERGEPRQSNQSTSPTPADEKSYI